MVVSYKKLCVDSEVFDMVLNECIQEFINHNPEFKKMHISHNKIIYELARFYLNLPKE